MKKPDIKNIIWISVFVAIMTVCSWIWVPLGVPFTLQALGVFIAAGLLGAKRAATCVLVYILLGLLGIPVFSGQRAGLGVLLGPTGGFIIGFIPMAYITGTIYRKTKKSPKTLILSMFLGLISCYAIGLLWYALVFLGSFKAAAFKTAFLQCIIPFLVPDTFKILLAAFLVRRLEKSVGKLFN